MEKQLEEFRDEFIVQRKSGNQRIIGSEDETIRLSDYQEYNVSKYLRMRQSEDLIIRKSEAQRMRQSDYQEYNVSEYQSTT